MYVDFSVCTNIAKFAENSVQFVFRYDSVIKGILNFICPGARYAEIDHLRDSFKGGDMDHSNN